MLLRPACSETVDGSELYWSWDRHLASWCAVCSKASSNAA